MSWLAKLGLRTQLIAALGVVFFVSYASIGITVVQLTSKAAQSRLVEPNSTQVGAAGTLAKSAGALRPLHRLLWLYLTTTGVFVLLLSYFALTYLTVRPVEQLTQAAQRLAAGHLDVEVPLRGAPEVTRLAMAFNIMVAELRSERQAREQRVAELEQTALELRTAQQELVRSAKLASFGRLAAGIAHEIGNPLAAILGLLELLQKGELDAAVRAEFLQRIQSETERIHRILRNLLDFSRPTSTSQAPPSSTDLAIVIDQAVRLMHPQKSLRGVRIEQDVAAHLPRVHGSTDQITQVLLNLLLNAADALEGRGCIRIAARQDGAPPGPPTDSDSRSDAAMPRWVTLSVADDGPGIPATVADQLFEPFVTTKAAGKGTGLGLAVCQTIVDGLGGHISVANRPDGGAAFTVRLPCA